MMKKRNNIDHFSRFLIQILFVFIVMVISRGATVAYAADPVDDYTFKVRLEDVQSRFKHNEYFAGNYLTGENLFKTSPTIVCVGCEQQGYCGNYCPDSCGTYNYDGKERCWQCWAFACQVGYDIFGIDPFSHWEKHRDAYSVKPGDIIRFSWSSSEYRPHSIFVYGMSGDTVYYADSNNSGACKVDWKKSTTKAELNGLLNNNYGSEFAVYHAPNNFTTGNEPGASFKPWYSSNGLTFVDKTNASIGQEINVYGGSCSKIGMNLFDANENILGDWSWSYSSGNPYYYCNIVEEMFNSATYLTPGTTYKYKWYAIVGGRPFESSIESFTTIPGDITASFAIWEQEGYTYLRPTDASVGRIVTYSGGAFTEAGCYLYDASGTRQLAFHSFVPTNNKIYFEMTGELGYVLTPGTTYKYQIYAVVGGQTFWDVVASFTTPTPGGGPVSMTFLPWENDAYTYIRDTDASVGRELSYSGGTCTEVGCYLYDVSGNQLAFTSFVPTHVKIYFEMAGELGYTLTPATTYQYRIYAVVGGITFWDELAYFTTLPGSNPTAKMDWSSFQVLPAKGSAYIAGTVKASMSGMFTDSTITIWDNTGNIVGSRHDGSLAYSNSQMNIGYEVYSELGILLKPSTNYSYQISVTFSGYTFLSPKASFRTEGASGRHMGIDVSQHQGTIDWDTVANYIDFVIIRCGYSVDDPNYDDSQWEANVAACERLGIPYGVYLYSYAENNVEALSEAEHVLRLLKGHSPQLPVYYDLEDAGTVGRLPTSEIAELVKTFGRRISQAGYKVGVYANVNWWNNYLTEVSAPSNTKWLSAHGGGFVDMGKICALWQFASYGRIPGINGLVDLDYSANYQFGTLPFDSYIKITPDFVLPGSMTTIEEEAFEGCAFTAVKIPNGVTSIGNLAFANCTNLAQIEIPMSVTSIASDAFSACHNVTIVCAPGSAAELFAVSGGYRYSH